MILYSVTLLNHEDQETSFTPLSIPGKRKKKNDENIKLKNWF